MAKQKRKAQVWILSKGDDGAIWTLLLQTNKKRGEFWQPVTGSVEEAESFSEGAWREAVEETQLSFEAKPLAAGYSFEFTSTRGHHIEEQVFVLTVKGLPAPTLDPSEHQAFQWLKVDEAAALTRFESNVEGLQRSLEAIRKARAL